MYEAKEGGEEGRVGVGVYEDGGVVVPHYRKGSPNFERERESCEAACATLPLAVSGKRGEEGQKKKEERT